MVYVILFPYMWKEACYILAFAELKPSSPSSKWYGQMDKIGLNLTHAEGEGLFAMQKYTGMSGMGEQVYK